MNDYIFAFLVVTLVAAILFVFAHQRDQRVTYFREYFQLGLAHFFLGLLHQPLFPG